MRHGRRSSILPQALSIAALVVATLSAPVPGAAAKSGSADEQLDFGIKMAKRGLWNEAAFRFSRVLEERPGDVRILNNLAVAYEAIGEFDLALEHYKRALEGDSSNRDLRRNYAQFVEFYESLRPQEDESDAGQAGDEEPTAEPLPEGAEAEASEAEQEGIEDGSAEPGASGS